MEETRFRQAAQTALSHYAIPYSTLTYLGHSENITYRVQTAGETYLLRIHFPVSADFRSPAWRQEDVITSEFLWLQALAQETSQIVPTPVQNQHGNWITRLVVDGVEETLHATVLHWIEGESLADQPTATQAAQLGELLADLHNQASRWDVPTDFTRPSYDLQSLHDSFEKIALLERKGLFSSADLAVLSTTVERIAEHISTFPPTPENWGLIHADLNEGNYLFHAGDIRAIDFSSCGNGYFLFDMTTAFLHLIPANRQALLTAYTHKRDLSTQAESLLETFFLWAILDNFGVLATKPEEHDYLAQDLPQVIARLCRPYLDGTPFLNIKAHS